MKVCFIWWIQKLTFDKKFVLPIPGSQIVEAREQEQTKEIEWVLGGGALKSPY